MAQMTGKYLYFMMDIPIFITY